MGGRQAVRPRTLDPVSKVRILPAQPLHRFGWLKSPLFGISQGAPFRGERRSCFTGHMVVGPVRDGGKVGPNKYGSDTWHSATRI